VQLQARLHRQRRDLQRRQRVRDEQRWLLGQWRLHQHDRRVHLCLRHRLLRQRDDLHGVDDLCRGGLRHGRRDGDDRSHLRPLCERLHLNGKPEQLHALDDLRRGPVRRDGRNIVE